MVVVVAMDSFKGSLSQKKAGEAVKEGILRAVPDAQVRVCPMADGGEGTAQVLSDALGGENVTLTVCGPMGEKTEAFYTVVDGDLCVMEMASAAGLCLVPREKRNLWRATTYGVGEMIRHAVGRGCRRFLIGIGGSATNDCGMGMLSALGYRFLDKKGEQLYGCCGSLSEIVKIDSDGVIPGLDACRFTVVCDVDNPLTGERGCTAVYGAQKGMYRNEAGAMERSVRHFARLTEECFPDADADYPGSGAAGGLGFALRTYLHGELVPGAEGVARETGLYEKMKDADLAICGEGKIDGQTVMGKAPTGVARAAKRYGVPVIAIAGCEGIGASECLGKGIDAYFTTLRHVCTLEEALEETAAYRSLSVTAEQVMRVFTLHLKNV